MKAMFLCKRARPDIEPGIGFLSTQVNEPNEGDWRKLLRILSFLGGTIDDVLTLEADTFNTLCWYIDMSFAVHPDQKCQTGFTLGKGAIMASSTKQKVNTRSTCEGELQGIDDKIAKAMWTKRFIESQGFPVTLKVYQDNKSTLKLAINGKESSGKRTRHFDIKLHYVTDLAKRKELQLEYCPSELMIADYMTKPLVGTNFKNLRQHIQQECVEGSLE